MKALWLAALLLLAGCATTQTGSGPLGSASPYPDTRHTPPADTMPEGPGHDHADPAQHKLLWNYAFSDRDPLLSNPASLAGVHALDLQDGWLFGAVYGSHEASVDGGIQVWDVHTDPAHPKAMGRWIIPGSVGGDRSIGATADGDYAVIGTEPVDCFGHVNPSGAALTAYLVDFRDKQRPLVADTLLVTGGTLGAPTTDRQHIGSHSVWVQRIGGKDYAFISGDIYEIARSEGGARLVPSGAVSTGHDVYVRETPWNTTWALSANADGGLVVHDVTDPARPFEVGTWDREDHAEVGWYFHTADVAFVGDQTLVIVTSEDAVPGDTALQAVLPTPTGETEPVLSPFWVLDGNPLRSVARGQPAAQLEEIGSWHNPWNHTAKEIGFSLHNPRFHDGGILTISSYHAGFFQLDLRHPSFWKEPSLIADGAYADGSLPAVADPVEGLVQRQLCGFEPKLEAPEQVDVAVGPNGVLYLADLFTGLYTFTPTPEHPVYGAGRTVEYTGRNSPGP